KVLTGAMPCKAAAASGRLLPEEVEITPQNVLDLAAAQAPVAAAHERRRRPPVAPDDHRAALRLSEGRRERPPPVGFGCVAERRRAEGHLCGDAARAAVVLL